MMLGWGGNPTCDVSLEINNNKNQSTVSSTCFQVKPLDSHGLYISGFTCVLLSLQGTFRHLFRQKRNPGGSMSVCFHPCVVYVAGMLGNQQTHRHAYRNGLRCFAHCVTLEKCVEL